MPLKSAKMSIAFGMGLADQRRKCARLISIAQVLVRRSKDKRGGHTFQSGHGGGWYVQTFSPGS